LFIYRQNWVAKPTFWRTQELNIAASNNPKVTSNFSLKLKQADKMQNWLETVVVVVVVPSASLRCVRDHDLCIFYICVYVCVCVCVCVRGGLRSNILACLCWAVLLCLDWTFGPCPFFPFLSLSWGRFLLIKFAQGFITFCLIMISLTLGCSL